MCVQPYKTVILCMLLLWSGGCHLSYRDTPASDPKYAPHRVAPKFQKEWVDGILPPCEPDSGVYYAFPSDDGRIEVAYPERMLEDLYTRGFDITHAWFRQQGGSGNTATIYGGFFILRLARADSGLEQWFHFRRIRRPEGYRFKLGILKFSLATR